MLYTLHRADITLSADKFYIDMPYTANLSISGVLIKVLTLQANHIQYYAAVYHRYCSLEFVTHVAFLQHDYALYAHVCTVTALEQ